MQYGTPSINKKDLRRFNQLDEIFEVKKMISQQGINLLCERLQKFKPINVIEVLERRFLVILWYLSFVWMRIAKIQSDALGPNNKIKWQG